ncbi:MAG: PilW family protein [Thalassotalea sp.]|nr:PilW family protein [Thalassotalea sp.]MDG2392492.1 PilW family protein [Thalassotalea sp.]
MSISITAKSTGFTLIEVMVSLTLGLFMLTMGMQSLLLINKSFVAVKQSAHMQENARFTFNFISRDIVQSRYWSDLLAFSEIEGSLNLSDESNQNCIESGNSWGAQIQQSIFAVNNSSGEYTCASNDGYLRGDILTLRYIEPTPTILTDSEQLYIKSNGNIHKAFLGKDKNLISNALTSSSTTHEIVSHSYFIGDSNRRCNNQVIPALYWQTLVNGRPQKEELLSGVENLQVQFGVDENLNSITDKYVNANQVLNWRDVKSVKIDLLVRSQCPDMTHLDKKTYYIGDEVYQPMDNFHRQSYQLTLAH